MKQMNLILISKGNKTYIVLLTSYFLSIFNFYFHFLLNFLYFHFCFVNLTKKLHLFLIYWLELILILNKILLQHRVNSIDVFHDFSRVLYKCEFVLTQNEFEFRLTTVIFYKIFKLFSLFEINYSVRT